MLRFASDVAEIAVGQMLTALRQDINHVSACIRLSGLAAKLLLRNCYRNAS